MKNRILSGLLATVLVVGSLGTTVNAAEVKQIAASEVESVYEEAVDSNSLEGWATGPQIYSEAGIVMDMDSGAILYAKNINDAHYPASITKVATALIALQNYEMDETVTFSQEDIDCVEYGYAHLAIRSGEELSMEDCMYGMMLASANEVAHAIGSHLEGGYDAFLKLMNETAKELGCTNSNFTNTNGMHDEEHYTTVHDMAILGAAAFQYEEFRKIITTLQYTIDETNLVDEKRTFQQHHKMLYSSKSQYYEYCVGGKTGYTDAALTTLVTFATKDDKNLVAVVMRTHGGGTNAYEDTEAMLDYVFDNFEKVSVSVEQIQNEKIAGVQQDAYVMLPSGVEFEQLEYTFDEPSELEDKTGVVTYTYQNQEVGSMEVTITDAYYNEIHGIEESVKEEKIDTEEDFSIIVKIILGVVVAVIIVVIGYALLAAHKKNKMRKRRRQKRREKEQRRRNK